jgi:hypothetical protein
VNTTRPITTSSCHIIIGAAFTATSAWVCLSWASSLATALLVLLVTCSSRVDADPPPPPHTHTLTFEHALHKPRTSYANNNLASDSHVLSNTSGRDVTLYVYNFGPTAVVGNVSAVGLKGASVTPSSWPGVRVPPGGRTRLEVHVAPPGGHAALDPTSGVVTLTGAFGEPAGVQPPLLSFHVSIDPRSLTPTEQIPWANATSPSAWVHNIAGGGTVQVTTPKDKCIEFAFAFDKTTADAWAYPMLEFNTPPPADADGIRYWIEGVGASVPISQLNVIFFDAKGTQYIMDTQVNVTDPSPQQVTVLMRDARYDGFGPPGTSIMAAQVSRLAVGLNLAQHPSTAHMTVCSMNWVRF